MNSRCDSPKFEAQDWSQFDFSRWHLDGLMLDAISTAFAGLSEQLFNSEEWRQHFRATLPEVEREALGFYRNHSDELHARKNAVAADYERRIAAAQQRTDDFRKSLETSAAPPVVPASPNTFHLAVRIGAGEARLGLPGLQIELADPRDEKAILIQAVTDLDGNAVLSIPEEIARELDKREATLVVRNAAGKELLRSQNAVCIRLNQVDTKIISVRDSREIEAEKTTARRIREDREARLKTLAARAESLKREREARLGDLDCRLAENQALIDELEAGSGVRPGSGEAI